MYVSRTKRTKKTEIVDVAVVNSITGAEGGKNQGVGQLLPGKGPE
jgi:hypothetical protein